MLKTLNIELIKSRKSRIKADGNGGNKYDSRNELNIKSKINNGEIDDNEIWDNRVAKEKNYQKTWKTFKSKKTLRFLVFFNSGTRLAFTKLKQAFMKLQFSTTLI